MSRKSAWKRRVGGSQSPCRFLYPLRRSSLRPERLWRSPFLFLSLSLSLFLPPPRQRRFLLGPRLLRLRPRLTLRSSRSGKSRKTLHLLTLAGGWGPRNRGWGGTSIFWERFW